MASVADPDPPDPRVFGPPGSGSFYHRAKIVRSIRQSSVADPGCLSRIPDPDFYPSRISDPGSKNSNKREVKKKLVVIPFYVAKNFTKL
jgi:hypothetical protein